MSKSKIVSAFRAALQQLPQTPETRVPMQRAERYFLEMRQLHSAAERGRHEAEELAKKQHQTITDLEAFRTDAIVALERQKQLNDRMCGLVNKRMSGELLDAETNRVRVVVENAALAVADGLGFKTPEQRSIFFAEFRKHLVPHYNKHSHLILNQANFFKHLLMLIIRQHGPLEIVEEESPADSYLCWVHRDGRWHLRLSPHPEDEGQPIPPPEARPGWIEATPDTVPPSGWILTQDAETGKRYWQDPSTLRKGDICSELTQEQMDRTRRISDALHEHDNRPFEEWVDNFRRDRHPENEIQIYEALLDVYYAELKDRPQAGPEERFLVYSALLTATMSGDCSAGRVVSIFPKTKKLANLERVVKRYRERRGFGNQPERTNMDYQKYCDKISELMRADGLTQDQFIVVCGIMFLSGLDVVIPPEARKMPWFTKMESAVTGIVRAASKKAAGESIIVPDDWTLDA